MSFLPALVSSLKDILTKPGDKFTAEITPNGNEVLKLVTSEAKRSAMRREWYIKNKLTKKQKEDLVKNFRGALSNEYL